MKNAKGVDISYANGNIDLSKVKAAGYDFVMIRCGQGGSGRITDNQFAANVKKAEALGMPWGVYLFTEACSTAAIKDECAKIDKLLKEQKAKGYRPTLPIALDVEQESHIVNGGGWNKSNVSNITSVFVKEMKSLGYYPMIYTGYYELRDWVSSDTLNNCDVWLAQWSSYPDWTKKLGIWQYGGETNFIESNYISGVGVIDKDICYRDYPSIIKSGGYNGWDGSGGGQKVYFDISMPYLAKSGYISTGEEVKTVQLLLNAMNYGKLTVDGVFGEATEEAVKKFQKSRKLDPDGIVGADTWTYLLK